MAKPDLLSRAQFAWVASGTATLESALLGTPHALVYRTSALTYFLAKQFVKVKFIGLPNLLLGREVVPELIQDALKPSSLLELSNLDRATQQRAFEELRSVLGGPGASARVAKQVLICFEPQPEARSSQKPTTLAPLGRAMRTAISASQEP